MGKKKKKHKGKKVATSEFFSTPPQEFVQQPPSRTMRSGRYASDCAATPESDSEECGIPAELFVKMSPEEEKRQKNEERRQRLEARRRRKAENKRIENEQRRKLEEEEKRRQAQEQKRKLEEKRRKEEIREKKSQEAAKRRKEMMEEKKKQAVAKRRKQKTQKVQKRKKKQADSPPKEKEDPESPPRRRNIIEFQVGDRVETRWEESDQTFFGIVDNFQEDECHVIYEREEPAWIPVDWVLRIVNESTNIPKEGTSEPSAHESTPKVQTLYKIGDRVRTKWEGTDETYVGVIEAIEDDVCKINYETEDPGWIKLDWILEIEEKKPEASDISQNVSEGTVTYKIGDRVITKWEDSQETYIGIIQRKDDNVPVEYFISYEEFEDASWVPASWIVSHAPSENTIQRSAKPVEPPKPPSPPKKSPGEIPEEDEEDGEINQEDLYQKSEYEVGEKVYAMWEELLYPAKIFAQDGDQYTVEWNFDGSHTSVEVDEIYKNKKDDINRKSRKSYREYLSHFLNCVRKDPHKYGRHQQEIQQLRELVEEYEQHHENLKLVEKLWVAG